MTDAEDVDFVAGEVSKSQRKREAQEVADLAEALVQAKPGVLAKVPVPDEIAADLALARKISSHIAKRRQILFLAKKMRQIDLEPIRAALEPDEQTHRQQVAQMHYVERWRERLLNDGDEAVTAFIDAHPETDRQQLRYGRLILLHRCRSNLCTGNLVQKKAGVRTNASPCSPN